VILVERQIHEGTIECEVYSTMNLFTVAANLNPHLPIRRLKMAEIHGTRALL
jgi:hypothetical protein